LLLNDINKLLKKNQLQAEELSKKIDQGRDFVQEKLLATDIRLEEKQKIFNKIQQIKEIAQEQKLEQQEELHNKALAKINKYKNNVLKVKADKNILQLLEGMEQPLNVARGKIKLFNEQFSVQVKTQQTEYNSETEIVGNLPEVAGVVVSGDDIFYPAEDVLGI
jgi:hypothetical protein